MEKALFTSNKNNWRTPKEFFKNLNMEFNFNLDACADDNNKLCDEYYSKENSCLEKSWRGKRVFMNPPYGRDIAKFIEKAYSESLAAEIIVMLLPARTDTKYFHEYILPYCEIRFVKGRLKFLDENNQAKDAAPFPSMVCVSIEDRRNHARYTAL